MAFQLVGGGVLCVAAVFLAAFDLRGKYRSISSSISLFLAM